MTSPAASPLSPFQQWIIAAMANAGGEVGPDVNPFGLGFEAEGRQARILPHPDPALAVIEVEVQSLADVPQDRAQSLAWELLRLNHEARFEHPWAAIIDDDEVLSLTTTVVMASMGRDALGEALLAGVEQAARLAVVTEALLADPDESTTEPERPTFDQLRV
jgi:hypothetical protein